MIGQVFRFEAKLTTPPWSGCIVRDEIVATLSTEYPFFIHFYHQINFGFESEMRLRSTLHHLEQLVCFSECYLHNKGSFPQG